MTSFYSDPVLIVDADHEPAAALQHVFRRDGLHAHHVASGTDAFAWLALHPVGLLVLDVPEPAADGAELIRRFRSGPETAKIPIVILTAAGDAADRLLSLGLRADEYITKPIHPREVLLRIRQVLRRSHTATQYPHDSIFQVGDLVIDAAHHEVRLAGQSILLTAAEFRILQRLATDPGHLLSRETLGAAVNPARASLGRTIDAHIRTIRRKLGPDGATLIQTVRGFGYLLRERAPVSQATTDFQQRRKAPGHRPRARIDQADRRRTRLPPRRRPHAR